MKQFLIGLTILLLATSAIGQSWAPTGAKWTFGVAYAFSNANDYREWTSIGDTIVQGQTCKLIKRSGWEVSGDISDNLITYEDSNKIFWYNINKFTVLYDFNKNAGESWTIMFDTCSLLITVDSTGIDTINGFPLKALYVSSDNAAFRGKILEHIGHLSYPNPNVLFHCEGIISDTDYYLGLRCYQDSKFGFHDFKIAPSCDYVVTGVNEIENPFGVSVFPNPAKHQINIKTNSSEVIHYKIFNIFGLLVETGDLQAELTTISIDNLHGGLYTIDLSANNTVQRQSFLVVK